MRQAVRAVVVRNGFEVLPVDGDGRARGADIWRKAGDDWTIRADDKRHIARIRTGGSGYGN